MNDDAPSLQAPTTVLAQQDTNPQNTLYYRVPVTTNTLGTAPLSVVKLAASGANDVGLSADTVISHGSFGISVAGSSSNPSQLPSTQFVIAATDGIVFSMPRSVTIDFVQPAYFTYLKSDLATSQLGQYGGNNSPNDFQYDIPVLSNQTNTGQPTSFVLDSSVQQDTTGTAYNASVAGEGVNLQTGALTTTQSFDTTTSSMTGSPFSFAYSSDTANGTPTVQGVLRRASGSSAFPSSITVRLQWFAPSVGTSGGLATLSTNQNLAVSAQATFALTGAQQNQSEYHFAISAEAFPASWGTGMYAYSLTACNTALISYGSTPTGTFDGQTLLQSYGQAFVVRNESSSTASVPNPFSGLGAGWDISGLPVLYTNLNYSGTTSYQPWIDDRAILSYGEGAGTLFAPIGIPLNSESSQTLSWQALDPNTHIALPQETGTLSRATISAGTILQWTYKTTDGTTYLFNEVNNSGSYGLTGNAAFLVSSTTATGQTTSFTYNSANQISQIAAPDGAVTIFNYTSGALTSIQLKTASSTLVKTLSANVSAPVMNGDLELYSLALVDTVNGTLWTRNFGSEQVIDVAISDYSQSPMTLTFSGGVLTSTVTSTFNASDFTSDAALQSKLPANGPISVALINPDETDVGPTASTNFRLLRFVISGVEPTAQAVSVSVSGSGVNGSSTSAFVMAHDSLADNTSFTTFGYDNRGQLSSVTNGNSSGQQDLFTIQTSNSQLWQGGLATQPAANVINQMSDIKTYNVSSGTTSLLNSQQRVAYSLDQKGRLLLQQTFYDAVNNGVVTPGQVDSTESNVLDQYGNVVMSTDALGRTTNNTFEYNLASRELFSEDVMRLPNTTAVISTSDFNPVVHANHYDVVTSVFQNFTLSKSEYDFQFPQVASPSIHSAVVRSTDANGAQTTDTLNSSGQPVEIQSPGNKIETISYLTGANSDLVSQTRKTVSNDDLSLTQHYRQVAFTYGDAANPRRVTKEVDTGVDTINVSQAVSARTTNETYDIYGNVATTTDQNGNVTTDTYDADGRLMEEKVQWLNGSLVTLSDMKNTYYQSGQVNTETNVLTTAQTSYTYDSRGLELTMTRTIATNQFSTTAPALVTTYTYYNDEELASESAPNGSTTNDYFNPAHSDTTNGFVVHDSWTVQSGVSSGSSTTSEVTQTQSDLGGRTLTTDDLLTGATTYSGYDGFDQLISSTDVNVNVGYVNGSTTTTTQTNETTLYEYDSMGNRVATFAPSLNPAGQTYVPSLAPVITIYNSVNEAVYTYVDAPHGSATAMTYDPDGNVISSTETRWTPIVSAQLAPSYPSAPSLITTSFTFDTFDELIETIVDPGAGNLKDTTGSYDGIGNLTQETVKENGVSFGTKLFVEDALGREVSVTNPDLSVETMQYDGAGNMTEDKLSSGSTVVRQSDYVFDALDRVRKTLETVQSGTQLTTLIDYTQGNSTSTVTTTDPTGMVVVDVQDSVGDPVSLTQTPSDGNLTQPTLTTSYAYSYSATTETEITTITSAALLNTQTMTNTLGDTLSVSNQYDVSGDKKILSTSGYDVANRQVQSADEYGNLTHDTYGDLATGLVTEVVTPTQTAATGTRTVYDSAGDEVALIDPVNNVTQMTFDDMRRETSATNVGSGVYNGLLTVTIDANGRITATTINPGTDTTVEQWFAPSDTGRTTPLETITKVTNAAGDPTSIIDYSNSTSTQQSKWTATYDETGRMTGSTEVVYVGPPTGGVQSPTATFTYGYNTDNALTSMTLAVGSTNLTDAYAVDTLDRTSGVTQTAHGITESATVTYLNDGRLSSLVRKGGTGAANSSTTATTAAYAYDSKTGLIFSLTHAGPTGSTLAQYAWLYDNNQRVSEQSYTNTPESVSYARDFTYDASGQLTSVNQVPMNTTTNYGYDANGNSTATGTTIGSFNELTNDGTYTYTYDAEGNRQTRTLNSGSSTNLAQPGYTTYAYDNRNRLLFVTVMSAPSGGQTLETIAYNYDALDRKVGETVTPYTNGSPGTPVTTAYIYAGSGTDIVEELTGSTLGTVSRTNLWLPGLNQLLASDLVNADGVSYTTAWPLFDEQGTIRDLYSSNGTTYSISQSLKFDEYGNVLSLTNASAFLSSFGTFYGGHELDSATGLYYANARWYDPFTHQFTQQDPAGFAAGDSNLYRYTGNQPTDRIDRFGFADSWSEFFFGKGAWLGDPWSQQVGNYYAPESVANPVAPIAIAGQNFAALNQTMKDNGVYTRIEGGVQALTAIPEGVGGGLMIANPEPLVTKAGGAAILAIAFDNGRVGLYKLIRGKNADTGVRIVAESAAEALGAEKDTIEWIGFSADIGTNVGSGVIAYRFAKPGHLLEKAPQAVPSGIVDSVEATGRLGGNLYDADKLGQLGRFLERRGVSLKVGDEFLPPGKGGGFGAFKDGTAELLLRSNPTEYEVWHELSHYVQWKKIGPEAYRGLPRWSPANPIQDVPEQFVFDLLENSKDRRWYRLTFEEQQHAIQYVQDRSGIR